VAGWRFAAAPTRPELVPPFPDGHRRPIWLAVPVLLFAIGAGCIALALTRADDPGPPPGPAAVGAAPPIAPSHPNPVRHPARRSLVDRSAAPPRWIRIRAIGVSAAVIPLHLNPDRTLQTPERWEQTGWYVGGPEPGERGPAVVAGHVDSTSGPAVFYRLGQLHRGASILIRRVDRSVVRFRVDRVERWPKDRFPTGRVYRRTADAELRLITCGGAFDSSTGHYQDNTIVYASRVSIRRS
jgi:hypothetical protein